MRLIGETFDQSTSWSFRWPLHDRMIKFLGFFRCFKKNWQLERQNNCRVNKSEDIKKSSLILSYWSTHLNVSKNLAKCRQNLICSLHKLYQLFVIFPKTTSKINKQTKHWTLTDDIRCVTKYSVGNIPHQIKSLWTTLILRILGAVFNFVCCQARSR